QAVENYIGVVCDRTPRARTAPATPRAVTGLGGRRRADRSGPTGLQVGARAGVGALGARLVLAGGQLPPHLLELLAGGHLLGEEGGLDAVEEPLEPTHELGLGHSQ